MISNGGFNICILTRIDKTKIKPTFAIILDGQWWAKKRGLPRTFGHYQGGLNIAKTAQICDELGIQIFNRLAFQPENGNVSKEVDLPLMTTPIKEFAKYKDKIIRTLRNNTCRQTNGIT